MSSNPPHLTLMGAARTQPAALKVSSFGVVVWLLVWPVPCMWTCTPCAVLHALPRTMPFPCHVPASTHVMFLHPHDLATGCPVYMSPCPCHDLLTRSPLLNMSSPHHVPLCTRFPLHMMYSRPHVFSIACCFHTMSHGQPGLSTAGSMSSSHHVLSTLCLLHIIS